MLAHAPGTIADTKSRVSSNAEVSNSAFEIDSKLDGKSVTTAGVRFLFSMVWSRDPYSPRKTKMQGIRQKTRRPNTLARQESTFFPRSPGSLNLEFRPSQISILEAFCHSVHISRHRRVFFRRNIGIASSSQFQMVNG
jgi:hypothetical protein